MDKSALRADARRNRARVLAAAEEAFAADGLAVPLDDIARRAGVGAGTVYRHFPSKEALFQAVVAERLEQYADEAQELIDAEAPAEAFYEYFPRVIEQASRNRAICEALGEAGGATYKAEVGERFRKNLTALLKRGQAAGIVRSDINGDDLRAFIIAALAVERHSPGDQRLVRVLLDGLR
ncbi:TetR/AcrR family transcriptional regulator [Amycolatopsis jiangsuensis]|uniref:AcrR family transcriptional regulator n=1 Tax=Amycolatopsis jiangsuensis TaxID=1181879 RepID=A0A840IYG5_9PSEU|nr:TetR/AcrR family transcriptional regulator [Amycolatopsis jiangsuensis]MBB4686880.1 AcrR family transcriptional regulator [Amycolatopsis jiangsuensis]